MKFLNAILFFVIFCLLLTTPFVAQSEAPAMEKTAASEECAADATTQEIKLLTPSAPNADRDVSYVSGGICIDEVAFMKSIANQFPLEIVLVQKNNQSEKEHYIADVNVSITNQNNEKIMLNVFTDGPFLLVNIPEGQYLINANYNNDSQEKKVTINHQKHARVVFLWQAPAEEE